MKFLSNSKLLLLWSISAIVFFLSACTQNKEATTPEGALGKYVNAAFSAKSLNDKKQLMEMTTGDALAYLQKMKDEDFKKLFLESKLKLVSLKAKDIRKDNEGDVSLIYELSFKDSRNESATVYTNKKIAYLTKADGNLWKIRATQNVKSFIEKKEALVITPELTGN